MPDLSLDLKCVNSIKSFSCRHFKYLDILKFSGYLFYITKFEDLKNIVLFSILFAI